MRKWMHADTAIARIVLLAMGLLLGGWVLEGQTGAGVLLASSGVEDSTTQDEFDVRPLPPTAPVVSERTRFKCEPVPMDCIRCGTAIPYIHFMTRGPFEDAKALRVGLSQVEGTEAVLIEVIEFLGRAGSMRVVEQCWVNFFSLAADLPALRYNAGRGEKSPHYFSRVTWIGPRSFEVITLDEPLVFTAIPRGFEVEVKHVD